MAQFGDGGGAGNSTTRTLTAEVTRPSAASLSLGATSGTQGSVRPHVDRKSRSYVEVTGSVPRDLCAPTVLSFTSWWSETETLRRSGVEATSFRRTRVAVEFSTVDNSCQVGGLVGANLCSFGSYICAKPPT